MATPLFFFHLQARKPHDLVPFPWERSQSHCAQIPYWERVVSGEGWKDVGEGEEERAGDQGLFQGTLIPCIVFG